MEKAVNKPEIRYKGFTDDWEQRKVQEIYRITRGYVLAAPETDENPSDDMPYPVYSSQTKNNGLMGYYKDYLYENAITWTTDGANAGTVNYRAGKFYCTNVCGVLLSDEGYANKCAAEALNSVAWRWVSHVGNPKLMNNVMGEIPISLPKSVEEQNQISRLFEEIDNFITLHQRKCDKLVKVKKAMLVKMFPRNGETVPEIRFHGFTDAWEQRKVSSMITDIADGPFGSNLKTEHYTEEKEARIIQLSNLSDYGWQEENTRYTTFEHAKDIKRCIVNEGELVMGKMMPAGMTIMRPNTEKMYVLSSDCVRIKLDNDIAVDKFFLYTTKSDSFLNQVNNDSQGSTRVRTSISKIRDMDISIPSVAEQERIGEYFTNLDNLITLHQCKLEKLKNIKKSMHEKMFV